MRLSLDEIKSVMLEGINDSPLHQAYARQALYFAEEYQRRPLEVLQADTDANQAAILHGAQYDFDRNIWVPNPEIIVDRSKIVMSPDITTYADKKEEGFRLVFKHGIHNTVYGNVSMQTRQFNYYPIPFLPELSWVTELPFGIFDTEIISTYKEWVASLNTVKARITQGHWMKHPGEVPDDKMQMFYDLPIWKGEEIDPRYALTLSFHGLIAIAHPDTWEKSREDQKNNLISLAQLPINYPLVRELLEKLQDYQEAKGVPIRIATTTEIKDHEHLDEVVQRHFDAGHEGCVVKQYAGRDRLDVVKSYKIKRYESLDLALLGLTLIDPNEDVTPENLRNGIVGVFDPDVDTYVAALKFNLNPNGPQMKTDDQRSKLMEVNSGICSVVDERGTIDDPLLQIYDCFIAKGLDKLRLFRALQGKVPLEIGDLLANMPNRQSLMKLLAHYQANKELLEGEKKVTAKRDHAIREYLHVFQAMDALDPKSEAGKEFFKWFSRDNEMKNRKFDPPHIMLPLDPPIIFEVDIREAGYTNGNYPAGLHTWKKPFTFNNVIPQGIRRDKSNTTTLRVLHEIAKMHKA